MCFKAFQLGSVLDKVMFSPRIYLTCTVSTSWDKLGIGGGMGGRENNTLRYADDTTLLAESKE